jgi:hypothetical protein
MSPSWPYEDTGNTFLQNVKNYLPMTWCHIPEDQNPRYSSTFIWRLILVPTNIKLQIHSHSKCKAEVKLSQCMPSRQRGCGGTAPLLLNLSTGWRWVISFSCFTSNKGTTLYAMNRRRLSTFTRGETFLTPPSNCTLEYPHSLVTTLTELFQLPSHCKCQCKVLTKSQ